MRFIFSSLLGKCKGKGKGKDKGKGKGKSRDKYKVHHRTYHESTEGGRYSSSLSLTSVMNGAWMVNAKSWSLYPWKREPLRMLQEAWWALSLAWTAVVNLTPTGIQFPNRFVCNESTYRLRYLGLHLARVHFILGC
jgi:hypothetical protein